MVLSIDEYDSKDKLFVESYDIFSEDTVYLIDELFHWLHEH